MLRAGAAGWQDPKARLTGGALGGLRACALAGCVLARSWARRTVLSPGRALATAALARACPGRPLPPPLHETLSHSSAMFRRERIANFDAKSASGPRSSTLSDTQLAAFSAGPPGTHGRVIVEASLLLPVPSLLPFLHLPFFFLRLLGSSLALFPPPFLPPLLAFRSPLPFFRFRSSIEMTTSPEATGPDGLGASMNADEVWRRGCAVG